MIRRPIAIAGLAFTFVACASTGGSDGLASRVEAESERAIVAAFIGDSITGGLTEPPWAGLYYEEPYPAVVGRELGWTVHNLAVPSSGYLDGEPSGTMAAVVDDVLALAPDVVVIAGGANDVPYDDGTYPLVEKAAHDLIHSLESVPAVYVLSPMSGRDVEGRYGNAAKRPVGDAIRRAAEALGRPYVDMLNPPWLHGTGTSAEPSGDGNCDLYMGGDGIHPNQAGEDFIGQTLAALFAKTGE